MKCNLPKGFKANRKEENTLDRPVETAQTGVSYEDKKNISLGAGMAHRLPQGTGRTYNFAKSAKARRNEQVREHNAVMEQARQKEGSLFLQRCGNLRNKNHDEDSYEM